MNEKNYLALLHKIWLSHTKLHSIFKNDNSFKKYYENISSSKLKIDGFSPKQIENILLNKEKYNIANIDKKLLEREVKIISFNDKDYPDLLKQISNPPFLLYLRWKLSNTNKISVVWSRNISSYWEKVIEKIIPELSKKFIIVSWWALWCDTYAHKQCIKAWNSTISIIWTWIDIDYPVWNKNLYNEIVLNWWAVISIFPIWELWNPYNFPIRNEIVAWLSLWTLVIEAKEKSWTLITAQLTLDLWRDLFAIPWDIFNKNNFWTNKLISEWSAKLVSNINDIFNEYNISDENKSIVVNFSDEIEEKIYNLLLVESLVLNEISNKLDININTLSFKISMMEINNLIKKDLWWKYRIF